jgi:hypothetical protein
LNLSTFLHIKHFYFKRWLLKGKCYAIFDLPLFSSNYYPGPLIHGQKPWWILLLIREDICMRRHWLRMQIEIFKYLRKFEFIFEKVFSPLIRGPGRMFKWNKPKVKNLVTLSLKDSTLKLRYLFPEYAISKKPLPERVGQSFAKKRKKEKSFQTWIICSSLFENVFHQRLNFSI